MKKVDPKAQEAVETVLVECWQVLRKHQVDAVVVGGWVARLFNELPHPGTLDVDLLLAGESLNQAFPAAVDDLLRNHQYLPNGKNAFQLSKSFSVGNRNVLFHVDFLNQSNTEDSLVMERGDGEVRSIYTQPMEVVFKYRAGERSRGVRGHDIRFPSAANFLVTKIAALSSTKRRRDPFDIVATIAHSAREELVKEFASHPEDTLFRHALEHLERCFNEAPQPGAPDVTATHRAVAVLSDISGTWNEATVRAVVNDFVADVRRQNSAW